ncbi:MAG: hypothetical protein INH40_19955 [Acidobacteriaceae bacterium]|jgi:hypothetical protein|nr:hypothetical protein [Acidobacteriaceae bacterium]
MGTLHLVTLLWAQALLPASWTAAFERPAAGVLTCDVTPTRPYLNFGFRFQAGYFFTVPLAQLAGPGHQLQVVTRVTPEIGPAVVLGQRFGLPPVPKTSQLIEVAGGYLLGEGKYRVDWILYDERNRACRKSWRLKVARSGSEKRVDLAMPPHTVTDFSLTGLPPPRLAAKAGGPITILLNAAPLSPRRLRLRVSDELLLVGALSSLVERLGGRPLRLVVFNLDQRQQLYEKDDFEPAQLNAVSQAINQLELDSVDLAVLQNPKGHIDFLAGLLNREAAETVVLLGPTTRHFESMPAHKIEKGSNRIFNLQFLPFWRFGVPPPDLLDSATRRRKGKTMLLRTPADFAKAIAAL